MGGDGKSKGSSECPERGGVTRAIILADGRAAFRLAGLTLLKRAILSARGAGITACVIVTSRPELQQTLPSDLQIGIPTHFATSLAEAGAYVRSPAILLPAHHLYDPQVLIDLQDAVRNAQTSLICADASAQPGSGDIVHDSGYVRLIGARAPGATARDTGLWYCRAELLNALTKAPEADRDAAVQALAESGGIRIQDIEGRFWRVIETRQDIRPAEKGLLKTLIKSTDGFISRHVNRRASLWMSRWLVRTPVTPNQISILTMLISFWSAWWVATGMYTQMALGGLLFQFASILDGSDGEVAKLKFLQSSTGELVDTLADDISFVAFFAAIVLGMYHLVNTSYVLILGGIAVALIPLIFLVIHRFLKLAGTRSQVGFVTALSEDVPENRRGWFYRASNALKFVCRRDFFSAAICLLLLADRIEWVYWIFIVSVLWFAAVVFGYTGYMLYSRKRASAAE